MSDIQSMLSDAITRLLTDYCTKEVVLASEKGVWASDLWTALTEAGVTTALAPEDQGGCGLDLAAALRLAGCAAGFTAPIPLGEHYLACAILAGVGITHSDGPLTIAPSNLRDQLVLKRAGTQWHLTGTARRVPWARHCNGVVVSASFEGKDMVALVVPAGYTVREGANIGGEPRDTLCFDATLPEDAVAPAASGSGRFEQHALGAALRSVQMASVLAHTLDITVQYGQDRVQFGRALTKFQAVQHNLAVLASQSAAGNAAADIALDSLQPGIDFFNIAAAKVRSGEAASIGAGLAHQVHGAIGMTLEYELNLSTRRLWSWRDEFGNEAEWAAYVGRKVAAAGADELWSTITSAGLSNVVSDRSEIGENRT